jgi:hypothetical protein
MYCASCKHETEDNWELVAESWDEPYIRCPNCSELAFFVDDFRELEARFFPTYRNEYVEAIYVGWNPAPRFRRAKVPTDREHSWPVFVTEDGEEIRAFKATYEPFERLEIADYLEDHGPSVNILSQPTSSGKPKHRKCPVAKLVGSAWNKDFDWRRLTEHNNDVSSDNRASNLTASNPSANAKKAHENRGKSRSNRKGRLIRIRHDLLDELKRRDTGAKGERLNKLVNAIVEKYLASMSLS